MKISGSEGGPVGEIFDKCPIAENRFTLSIADNLKTVDLTVF